MNNYNYARITWPQAVSDLMRDTGMEMHWSFLLPEDLLSMLHEYPTADLIVNKLVVVLPRDGYPMPGVNDEYYEVVRFIDNSGKPISCRFNYPKKFLQPASALEHLAVGEETDD